MLNFFVFLVFIVFMNFLELTLLIYNHNNVIRKKKNKHYLLKIKNEVQLLDH